METLGFRKVNSFNRGPVLGAPVSPRIHRSTNWITMDHHQEVNPGLRFIQQLEAAVSSNPCPFAAASDVFFSLRRVQPFMTQEQQQDPWASRVTGGMRDLPLARRKVNMWYFVSINGYTPKTAQKIWCGYKPSLFGGTLTLGPCPSTGIYPTGSSCLCCRCWWPSTVGHSSWWHPLGPPLLVDNRRSVGLPTCLFSGFHGWLSSMTASCLQLSDGRTCKTDRGADRKKIKDEKMRNWEKQVEITSHWWRRWADSHESWKVKQVQIDSERNVLDRTERK